MVRFDTETAGARSQQRQCWLGMQAAYRQYRQASALVHSLADDLSNDAPSLENALKFQAATHDERTAFEGYIEARLQFLESSCDQNKLTAGPARPKSSRFVCAAAAIIVGLSALNLLSLSWARRQVADLNTIRREMNTGANESNQGPPPVSNLVAPNPGASRASSTGANLTQRASKRSRPASGVQSRPIAHLVRDTRYAYSEFSVAISPRFTHIGTMRLSVRSVDRRARRVDLCVASGTATFCKNGVNPNEWLPVYLGPPRRSVELLVTRVGSSRVQGYFRTPGIWPPLKVNSLQTH
jgi:hypothetical protein